MAQNSLFAILLRSPWWISFIVAAVITLVARMALPQYSVVYGILAGLPFIVVGCIAGWRQFKAPSAASVANTLATAGSLSWRDFSGAIEDAFRRDGYDVSRLDGPAADFMITRAGRTALVSCKRWKAVSNGLAPLRDLDAAAESREAGESIFITLGELTDNARRFAAEKKIRVVQGAGLAQLLRGIKAASRGTP
jgi:restriction system protein